MWFRDKQTNSAWFICSMHKWTFCKTEVKNWEYWYWEIIIIIKSLIQYCVTYWYILHALVKNKAYLYYIYWKLLKAVEETTTVEKLNVVEYKPSAFFWNLCNLCMNVRTLSLLSCVHSLGLGLDLGNSLNRRERTHPQLWVAELWKKSEKKQNLTTFKKLYIYTNHIDSTCNQPK